MKIFQGMAISASALTAEKLHLDVVANNIANIESTRTPEGGPYQRKVVVFEELMENQSDKKTVAAGRGVRIKEIVKDEETPFKVKKDPNHPDADQDGNVLYPNVDLTGEFINMMIAQRSYQANAYVFTVSRTIVEKSFEISRG